MNRRSIPLILLALLAVLFVWSRPGLLSRRPPSPENKAQQQQSNEIEEVRNSLSPYDIPATSTVAGNYVAARFAVANDDLARANNFFTRAANATFKPETKAFLLERALPTAIGAGDMAHALDIAAKVDLKQPNATAQLGVLLQLADAFKRNDTAKINETLPLMRSEGFGRLLKPLLEAWHQAGQKDFAGAIATLEKLQKDYPSLQPLVQMHLALIYDYKQDEKAAALYYDRAIQDHSSVRMASIGGQFYERSGKKDQAQKLYQSIADQLPTIPWPKIALARLEKGDNKAQAFITTPANGAAAALYDVATVLHQENSSRMAVLYAQLAHYLMPEDQFTGLLLGDILASTNDPENAEKFFAEISENSDLYVLSQMRLAQLYEQQLNYPKAIEILEKFQDDPVVGQQAWMELGDLHRRKEDFAKAIPYYTKVLDHRPELSEKDWLVLYSRGICYERSNEWDKAEADLQQALKLSPQRPEVLNYLAYSWADHGTKIPEALDMLQKALAGAPDDPYITDSVGWALHKNGQNNEAVPYLEISVQQLPEDPVINDHLGDIYWAVGRKLEALFQWERSLKNVEKNLAKNPVESDKKLQQELQQKLNNPDHAARKTAASKTVSTVK